MTITADTTAAEIYNYIIAHVAGECAKRLYVYDDCITDYEVTNEQPLVVDDFESTLADDGLCWHDYAALPITKRKELIDNVIVNNSFAATYLSLVIEAQAEADEED